MFYAKWPDDFECPLCKERIQEGSVIYNMKVKEDGRFVVCPRCKKDVDVTEGTVIRRSRYSVTEGTVNRKSRYSVLALFWGAFYLAAYPMPLHAKTNSYLSNMDIQRKLKPFGINNSRSVLGLLSQIRKKIMKYGFLRLDTSAGKLIEVWKDTITLRKRKRSKNIEGVKVPVVVMVEEYEYQYARDPIVNRVRIEISNDNDQTNEIVKLIEDNISEEVESERVIHERGDLVKKRCKSGVEVYEAKVFVEIRRKPVRIKLIESMGISEELEKRGYEVKKVGENKMVGSRKVVADLKKFLKTHHGIDKENLELYLKEYILLYEFERIETKIVLASDSRRREKRFRVALGLSID
ncbi:MAG: hypothetical protein KJI72_04010 [Patescibacteria group bacterium]|nr:hypothetical protein [Patescibacteria group bacterium]